MSLPFDVGAARSSPGAFIPRIVVLDLDGTTIDYQQNLQPRVREAVRAVAARIPVIVATGRMYRSALYWAVELNVVEPLVCYQGAMVRETPHQDGSPGSTIYEQPLRAEPARRALHIAREQDWHFQAYQNDELLCERDRPEARLYAHISGVQFRIVPDIDPLLEHGTTKAACVIEDPAEVDRASALMARELGRDARVTRSNPEFVEILDPGISKAVGCEIVCARLGYTLADALAVGDAPNDVELLVAAGYSVAVSTSRPEVLAAADATCAPPEEGGVADVLDAFALL